MKKVLVFGIFDDIHCGHLAFLRQAKKCGEELIVSVGRSSHSKKIKNKHPKHSLQERLEFVQSINFVARAIPGDTKMGAYKVLKREKPDVICLGYDQENLKKDLERWVKEKGKHMDIQLLKPYKPKKYHTSLLRSKVD